MSEKKKEKLMKACLLVYIAIFVVGIFWALSLGSIGLMFYCAAIAFIGVGVYQGGKTNKKKGKE